jgi:hypothetical protein
LYFRSFLDSANRRSRCAESSFLVVRQPAGRLFMHRPGDEIGMNREKRGRQKHLRVVVADPPCGIRHAFLPQAGQQQPADQCEHRGPSLRRFAGGDDPGKQGRNGNRRGESPTGLETQAKRRAQHGERPGRYDTAAACSVPSRAEKSQGAADLQECEEGENRFGTEERFVNGRPGPEQIKAEGENAEPPDPGPRTDRRGQPRGPLREHPDPHRAGKQTYDMLHHGDGGKTFRHPQDTEQKERISR